MAEEHTLALRRLRYRAARLGSLELETWLQPVLDALESHPLLQVEIEGLLCLETPELFMLMHCPEKTPFALRPWLEINR
ncbi:MAG: succinate dehydrogenase assembly factor 2 [Mariprofundaceae bacterium]|nr:succinate dehydrogenase assembly factor 2 [Mariprofundaceae bacterium]